MNPSTSNHGNRPFVVFLEEEDALKEGIVTFYMFSKIQGMNSGNMTNLSDKPQTGLVKDKVKGQGDILDQDLGHLTEDLIIEIQTLNIDQSTVIAQEVDIVDIEILDLGHGQGQEVEVGQNQELIHIQDIIVQIQKGSVQGRGLLHMKDQDKDILKGLDT